MKKTENKIPHDTKISPIGPGRPKTLDKEAVTTIAMDAFWHNGLNVSLNSICELADVAKPSLYREFGNEDGLTLAAIERYFELSFGQLKELLLGPETFKNKLDVLATFVCEEKCNQHGCLFVKMRASNMQLGQKTKKRVEEIDIEMQKLFIHFFKLSRENKEWKSHLSDSTAANFLRSQIELAFSQRARGVSSSDVRGVLDIGLSALIHKHQSKC